MFGRVLDIALSKEDGTSLLIVDHTQGYNNLIVGGTIKRYPYTEVDSCTLNIYNLPSYIRGEIAVGGYTILTVKFGYEDENNISTIFQGTIQRLVNQYPSPETSMTIIYAWDCGDFKNYGFFSRSYDDGVNYYQIAKDICAQGNVPISAELSDKLKNYKVVNGRVFFTSQDDALQGIAQETGMLYTASNNRVSIIDKGINSARQDVTVMTRTLESGKVVSDSGLIGIPTLTSDGLHYDALINPKIEVYSIVSFDNSIISNEQTGVIPQRDIGAYLDSNGLYRVVTINTTFCNDGGDCKSRIKALALDWDSYL